MTTSLCVKKNISRLVAASLIMASCFSQQAYGQGHPHPDPKLVESSYIARKKDDTRVIKLKLSDAGISAGAVIAWGLGGLLQSKSDGWIRLELTGNKVQVIHTTRRTNWLTQFSKWWDHPVRNIVFKPDSCTSNSPECLITGTENFIELKDGMRVDKGDFRIEYLESDEWKTTGFRVPGKKRKEWIEI